MNTLKLKQFIKLCELQNMTKAANELYISQSALSQSIALLEKEIGCPLFERQNKSLILNPQGEIALRYAKEIVELSDRMVDSIKHSIAESKNLLIASYDSAFCSYLMAEFIMEHPEFNVSSVKSTENSVKQLENGRIDLLISSRKQESYGIISDFLMLDQAFVVVPQNSPHYGTSEAYMADFAGESFYRNSLLLQSSAEYSNADRVSSYLKANSFHINIAYLPFASLKLLLMRDLAPRNFFMASLSSMLEPEFKNIDKKRVIRLKDEGLTGEFWLSYRKKCSSTVKVFIKWLSESHCLE